MQCQTVRPGTECFFWKKAGGCCNEGGQCFEVIDKCEGCANILTIGELRMCKRYPNPANRWPEGVVCAMATHIQLEVKKDDTKSIDPLKASKRAARAR